MQKRKKILSGLSIAGLILAGSLPLMADQQKAKTCSCGKGGEKQKVKETSASKTKAKVKNAPTASKEVEKSKTAK